MGLLDKLLRRKVDAFPDVQFVWHFHHGTLLEPASESIEIRRAYIKAHKVSWEVKTRLRLIRPAKDIPAKFYELWRDPSLLVVDSVYRLFLGDNEAFGTYLYETYPDIINDLHKKQCVKDCPWNGTEVMFPDR